MASIAIRNPDDEVKTRLRLRAAGRGRSMEEDECFAPFGGVEFELPPREPLCEPPNPG